MWNTANKSKPTKKQQLGEPCNRDAVVRLYHSLLTGTNLGVLG